MYVVHIYIVIHILFGTKGRYIGDYVLILKEEGHK